MRYPMTATAADGATCCAMCACVELDASTYYHPVPDGPPEPTPFCSRSCFLYWQWRDGRVTGVVVGDA